ncbi:hypothetical protein, partial [Mesorhizobium sp.]|uniref:hypothetical protein n=1 Tax=Mesorhizobium sp. TaxID=1871066 RepID=UPI0025BB7695
PMAGKAVEARSSAEPASRPRREIGNPDILKLPSSPATGAGNLKISGIMALGKGFARDGFGACWLGSEIFVRWTSYIRAAVAAIW